MPGGVATSFGTAAVLWGVVMSVLSLLSLPARRWWALRWMTIATGSMIEVA